MNTMIRRDKGFTIIEVVLVLAIAALIFLMVFVGLPALQASQRDTARKNDASIVASGAQNYMSAERKSLTTDSDDVTNFKKYISKLGQYDATNVSVADQPTASDTTAVVAPGMTKDNIRVFVRSKCDGTQVKAGVSRSAAVVVKLEGGNGTNYCVDI